MISPASKRTVLSATITRAFFILRSYLLSSQSQDHLDGASLEVQPIAIALVKFRADNRIGYIARGYPAGLMQYASFTNRPLQLMDM